MDDLAERIKASLRNPNGEVWFPELTTDLAARAWDSLHRDIGLTTDSYGTERVLSRSSSAPREFITSLKTCPSACETAPTIGIEALTPESAIKYQEQGATFYTRDEILHTTILSCLEDALAIINQVPSLMRTVAALVRSLHVIKPEDADYDVSFSEPHVPFSIFVSVPEKRIANDALRIAEAIVHEAMHLQLTLIEDVSPLVNSSDGRYYSPWRGEDRNAGSIVHASYVFHVIQRFLVRLASIGSCPKDLLPQLRLRQREIGIQLDAIRSFQDCTELTAAGLILASSCLEELDRHIEAGLVPVD
jgi:HEXXH motif-containing protein